MKSKCVFRTLALVSIFIAHPENLFAAVDELRPSSGTSKDALRKAEQEGKLLMPAFYNDSYVDCKRLHAHLAEIPEASTKFIYSIVKGELGDAVVREHHISVFPTLVFLKPGGTGAAKQAQGKLEEPGVGAWKTARRAPT